VIEGIDGAGLSTQAAQLLHHFRNTLLKPVHLTKEPTDGPAGAAIRLKLKNRLSIDPSTLALLFAADRADHLATEVAPRLAAGINVISDRYLLSSYAYQSLNFDLSWLRALNAQCRRPDLTIFLDTPVDIALSRLTTERWQREYFEDAEQLGPVREHFMQLIPLLRQEGEQIVVIPRMLNGVERSVAEIAADVRIAVHSLFARDQSVARD
jgi:dTMP kinase